MALPLLSHFKPLTLKGSPKLHPFTSKPPNPNSTSFFLLKPPLRSVLRCSSSVDYDQQQQQQQQEVVVHERPKEIQWTKELANSVQLIGNIGAPVQIKHLNSGKVVAWTRLAVRKSPTDTFWINLTFWDELAHVASEHVEKGQQVFVSGRLVADTVEGDADEKPQVYYKVVVQKLNFIERNFPAVTLYESSDTSSMSGKLGNYVSKGSSTQELWQAFFANPLDWWDNRRNKRNPKAPDFKHKDTGEALWIESHFNPPWVESQLAVLDARMQADETNSTVSFMHGDDFSSF